MKPDRRKEIAARLIDTSACQEAGWLQQPTLERQFAECDVEVDSGSSYAA